MTSKNNKDCPMSLTEDKSWTRGEFDYARDPCDAFRAQCFDMMKQLKKSNKKEQVEKYGKNDFRTEAIPEVSINDCFDEYSITSLELQFPLLMTTSNTMCTPDKTRYVWDWLEDNEFYCNSNKSRDSNRTEQKKSQKRRNNNSCSSIPNDNRNKNKDLNKCGNVPQNKIKDTRSHN